MITWINLDPLFFFVSNLASHLVLICEIKMWLHKYIQTFKYSVHQLYSGKQAASSMFLVLKVLGNLYFEI